MIVIRKTPIKKVHLETLKNSYTYISSQADETANHHHYKRFTS